MKKIVALLLAAMMMVAVFAGCGGQTGDNGSAPAGDNNSVSDDGNTETGFNVSAEDFGDETGASLKVWGPSAYAKLLKQQTDAFVDMYPDQKIKIKIVAQGESDAGTNVIQDPQAAADVFGFVSDQLNNLVNAGAISPINTRYADAVKATDLEAAINAATLKNPKTGKDTLYAFPETGNGYYLVYDKSVVSAKQAQKLEDVLEACKKAGKKFIMDAGTGFYSCMFVFTGGLSLDGLEKDGVTQKFNKYDEKEVVDTMKAFSTLVHKYAGTFSSLAVDNIPSGFVSTEKRKSTCGAGIDGTWNSAADKEALGDNFGAAKLPTINVNGEDKQIVSLYGYKMIGVNSASKYPRTSQILAYYLASEECQKQRVQQLGWDPTNKNIIDSDDVKNDPALSALVEQSQHAVPQVSIGKIWDPLATLGNKLIAEETDPEKYDFAKLLKDTIVSIKDE